MFVLLWVELHTLVARGAVGILIACIGANFFMGAWDYNAHVAVASTLSMLEARLTNFQTRSAFFNAAIAPGQLCAAQIDAVRGSDTWVTVEGWVGLER